MPLLVFRKSYVKAHQRRLKNGQVITIPAHYDKRTKKGAEAPLAHGHDLRHLDEAKRAAFEKMHAEQHLLHHYHAHALRQRVDEQAGHLEGLAQQVAAHRAAGRHVDAAKVENQRLRLHSRHRVNQRELDDIEQRLAGLAGMKEALVQGSGAIDASTDDSHRAYAAKLGDRFKAKAKPESKPAAKPQEYRYALVNRPFGIGTAPKDGWLRTEPRPAEGEDHHGLARHGFAIYSRPLTDQETSNFELTPIVSVDEHAQRLVAKMGRYAAKYAEPENAELLTEYVTQNARHVGVASTDDLAALQQRVLARIGQAVPAKPAAQPFTPTHELPDGTPVRATGEKGVYTDASGAEIEDDYAKPVKAAAPKPTVVVIKPAATPPAETAKGQEKAAQEQGPFGPVFRQYHHDAAGAIAHLRQAKTGEAVAALHHPDVGDIDLVWGVAGKAASDGYGLAKLIQYHPEVLDDLQGILAGMSVTTQSSNRINLESADHKGAIRLTWDGATKHWLLTAFEKKKKDAADTRADTAGLGRVGDTARQPGVSAESIEQSASDANALQEGDTKTENGISYVLKDGRWHRTTEEGLRYDPATNRHSGKKLVRGDVLQGADGQRYTLDRDMGFALQVDALGADGRIVPASTRTISVDPSDRDRFLEVSLTGENLFDAQAPEAKVPAAPAKTPAPEAPADDLDPSSPNYRYRDTGYVGGSRKELAAAMLRTAKRDGRQVRKNDIDWETLETNPREAKEVITKSHLFGTVDWEGLKADGLTPGAGFVMDRVYASVGTGPRDDTPQARQDYALGLETLRNRLEVCRTPEEIEKTLAEIKEERDGVNLNSEEAARYQELDRQAEAAYAPVHAYKRQEYELDKAVSIAHRIFYAAESPSGHRRGGKYTPDQQASIDKARAGLEAAQQAKQALVDAHPEMQEETVTVHTAKGSMTTWTRPAEKEWRRIRQQQDVLVADATARNQVESPMLRAWSQLGERFNAVLDHRTSKGSDTFLNHLATAKLGRIKDWSWQKTTQTGTKAPRQVTEEGKRFQLQVADSHERVGGRSVAVASTADLKERFGLREVQSGNWVLRDPVSAKFHTEQTAGALADLADILGITDQQVAMNGRVALAFGARGTGATSNGAARAHYETVSRIINLTKMGGGGCLAHEWLHALDNLLLETQGGTAGAEDFLTHKPNLLPPGPLREAFHGLREALTTGQHRIKQRLVYTPEHYRLAQQHIARTHIPAEFRDDHPLPNTARLIKESRDASTALDKLDILYEPLIARGQRGAKKHLADWRNVALAYHGGQPEGGSLVVETGKPRSAFAMEAVKLDLGAAGKYWSRTEELAARAFQSYVEDKLASQGRRNDYLSAKADNKYYRLDGTAPFPEGEERTRINAAFDKLIAAMQADNSLAKALARTRYPRRLVVFRKSYIHGHYRKNPKTGEMVWVESFSDKRTTKQGQTLFAHDLHRQDHFKQNLAEGRLREAMHSFHDLDHDAAHKLAGTLGLHNGDKHADKKELMRAVRGKVLQQQQDYQAQVKMQEDKAKGKGQTAKPAAKPEAKPEVTPAPPTAEMDMHAVMDSAEKHLGTDSTFEIFDHLPQRTGDDPRWSKAEMYRAIMAIQKERKADKHGQAKQALLAANGGSPLGIEAKKPDSNRHALILPDASNPGKYRYSAYDEHGFYTHATHDTADKALDEAIKEGFTEHAPGSLDRLSQTDTWAQGMQRAAEAQAGWKAPAKAPESPSEAPAAKTPSQPTAPPPSPAQPDPEDQVLDINGAEVPYAWQLVDAEDLAPTSEKADNQFRDRTRAASDEQVASMAANLKFRLLSDSPLMDYGAPVLAKDGKTIIGGNGRSLAIRRAYGMGQADGYQQDLTKRAARFGIDPAAVAKLKAPVLVRVLQQDVDIKQAAIASNEGGGARMSALEQARVDGERLGDLSDFEADEEGNFNTRANLPFIRRFLSTMPVAQRSAFQAADGGLSQEGISRLRNAVLYRAYGDSDVLSRLVESADPAQRNVLSALTRAAPTVAQASADVKAGNLHDLDVSADIVAATTLLAQVRGEGKFGSVDEYLNQQNLFGDPLSDATKIILKHFDRNLRSSKAMAGFLTDYYAAVRQIGDPKQIGMFADATPDKPTLLRQTDAQRQNAPSPQAALF